jgi:hypothetical protein
MPKRQSRRKSRAQKRQRQTRAQKGGRREDVPAEEKKEETGILGGLFGGDDKKEDVPAAPADAPAPAEDAAAPAPAEDAADAPKEEEEKKEEGGMFSGLMGTKPDAAPAAAEGEKKPKGKKKRHGKYYTPKQLKMACRKMSSKKRNRKNKGKFANFAPTPMPMGNSPYSFGERPVM